MAWPPSTHQDVRTEVDALREKSMGLRRRKQLIARQESVPIAANGTLNLMTTTGSGTVSHIFIAAGAWLPGAVFNARLQILTDGRATPDVDVDLGTLFLAHFFNVSGGTAPRRAGCDMVATEASVGSFGSQAGFNLNLDIPFRNGITVRILAPSEEFGMNVYTQVFYDRETPAPLSLRSAGLTYNNRASVTAAQTHTMLNIPAGNSGWLVWQSIFGATTDSTFATWLERDVEVRVDQEATPAMMSTGLEDWFLGAFYYHGSEWVSYPHSMVGVNFEGKVAQGVDLRKAHGGIRFNNGVSVVLGTESAVSVTADLCHATLYYLDV